MDRRAVLQMPDDSPEPPALNAIAQGLDKPLLVRRHQQHLELLADGRGVRLRVCHGDVADEGLLFMRFERAAAVAVLRRALGGFRIGRNLAQARHRGVVVARALGERLDGRARVVIRVITRPSSALPSLHSPLQMPSVRQRSALVSMRSRTLRWWCLT